MTAPLPKIAVPTCVIVGSADKITRLAPSEAMRSRIPGAGRFSNAENPEAFNESLGSFLRRL
jgi:pimeloyl-ACP methyl ester carboxylesterase